MAATSPKQPPRAQLAAELREVKQKLAVLHAESVEMRGVQKRLVTVLNELHLTIHDLLVEVRHARTARERADHLADFAEAATQGNPT